MNSHPRDTGKVTDRQTDILLTQRKGITDVFVIKMINMFIQDLWLIC